MVVRKLQALTSFSQFVQSTIRTSNTNLVRLPQTMPSQSPYWNHNIFVISGVLYSCGQWNFKFMLAYSTYHSIQMQDECKQHSQGDACQVERGEVDTRTNLLLTTSIEHTCMWCSVKDHVTMFEIEVNLRQCGEFHLCTWKRCVDSINEERYPEDRYHPGNICNDFLLVAVHVTPRFA
mgnify:CR=1 FL=1